MEYDYGLRLVIKYVIKVIPEVKKELAVWSSVCKKFRHEILGDLALSGLRLKKSHARGGSIYSLYPGTDFKSTIKFITAFQAICDYLNSLCGRAGVKNESAFRELYISILDAVDPLRDIGNYYKYYPFDSDNGYLEKLVKECRTQINTLPSYKMVIDEIKKHIQLYSDLQTYKHLDKSLREDYLKTWSSYYLSMFPVITWWEFSAAAGSTLGIFALFAAASNPDLSAKDVKALGDAYFPWICGLDKLLDYYIGDREDLQTGDLNLTDYYRNLKGCEDRLLFFANKSLSKCKGLKYNQFHKTVVNGFLAIYLSAPEAFWGMNKLATKEIIENSKDETRLYHNICRALRISGIL